MLTLFLNRFDSIEFRSIDKSMRVDVFSAWAVVDVNMEDRVDVFLKDEAEISCIYTLKETAKMIVWFTVRKTGPFALYIIFIHKYQPNG